MIRRGYVAAGILILVHIPSSTSAQMDQRAQATQPTVSQRLRALENKTGFYRNTTKKITATLSKASEASTASLQCAAFLMSFGIDPGIATGGTAYAWPKLEISYAAGEPLKLIKVTWKTDHTTFQKSVNLKGTSNGTAFFKDFGISNMSKGEMFSFEIYVYSKRDVLPACDVIQNIKSELKITVVEPIEPE